MNGRWWLRLVAVALAVVQIPVLSETATDPSQSDFGNYFTPAFVLARGGEIGALYDRETFATAKAAAGLSVLGSFVPHPPANALWLLPVARLPPARAKGWWTGVLVLCLALTIWLTCALLPQCNGWLAAVLVLAPFLAVRNNFAFGQPYLVLSAFLVGGAVALKAGFPFAAGLLLGLGVSFKPYALCLGVLFLHRERRWSLAGFVLGAVLPSLAVLALNGPGSFNTFVSQVLPWMVRGDIQDPFSPVWGSVGAFANRLFRLEPDLNPDPWIVAPLAARFIGAAAPAALVTLAALSGRKAMREGRLVDAVGLSLAFSLAASPFAASYHLVLLVVPVAAVAARLEGPSLAAWLVGWAALGSPLMNVFRDETGILMPLAYARFLILVALALLIARPYLQRFQAVAMVGVGALAGTLAASDVRLEETWPRVAEAKGYSMMNPHFCGADLRWFVPSRDGRGRESRGSGHDCGSIDHDSLYGNAAVISRFTDGSWNLHLARASHGDPIQLTFSDANEVDPVFTPDGCGIVFASDQGRGLGSTALYRLDVSRFTTGC